MSDELEDILEELKNDDSISTLNEQPSSKPLNINDENVNDYIMEKVGCLIESGIETVNAIQDSVQTGTEAEEIEAFSGLISAITKAADTLNKINVTNKKIKSTKEIKQLEINAKAQLNNNEDNKGNTNILIATREEVIERFLEKNKKCLEADYTETNESENNNE